ncbi:MAG: hypothetical protein WA210_11535 [Burkholderiaceae bacterium]
MAGVTVLWSNLAPSQLRVVSADVWQLSHPPLVTTWVVDLPVAVLPSWQPAQFVPALKPL